MRVLIVGEGKHECSGALQTIVERVLGAGHVYEHDLLHKGTIHAFHGTGQGYLKKAIRWMLEAQRRGYDAIVLLVDRDNDDERTTQMAQAQESEMALVRRALGVAIRTFDAWMLADETAISKVLRSTVQRQKDPETMPEPKVTFAWLLQNSICGLGQAEAYLAIANVMDLDQAAQRCPKGLGIFVGRLRTIVA